MFESIRLTNPIRLASPDGVSKTDTVKGEFNYEYRCRSAGFIGFAFEATLRERIAGILD